MRYKDKECTSFIARKEKNMPEGFYIKAILIRRLILIGKKKSKYDSGEFSRGIASD